MNNKIEKDYVNLCLVNKLPNYEILIIKLMIPILTKSLLTKKQKECFDLYWFNNLSQTDISNILSVSQSTVSRHIKSAKNIINSYLHFIIVSHSFISNEINNEEITIEKPLDIKDTTIKQPLFNNKNTINQTYIPLHMEDRVVLIKGKNDKKIRGRVEFVDDTGNVYIELINGKNIVLTSDQLQKAKEKVA